MAERNRDTLLNEVADYYSAKLKDHGTTAKGVDWSSADSQILRFEQLLRILRENEDFSLNDLGCGYGALLHHLQSSYPRFSYMGVDVSEAMIEAASRDAPAHAAFHLGSEPQSVADYSVASGIFNVRLSQSESDWAAYMHATVDVLDRSSSKGFAFNCLTSYSDSDKMRPDLHYADPCYWFDLCKRKYSRSVALLHDYGLYEFTLLVRK
ncbi:class I SAM-dependent methyltransferase [Achromobacter aegrifaciens]|uniref:class I SAM-dependent methyltransferase n=1 Tax=Achromobacter aegrifaciens TaxID=1287736 RepID=UPI001AD8185E|nr:class I SAM-dependent methyltransferase [Achromobacter aegrifaciens]